MASRYFEDFETGDTVTSAPYAVTRDAITDFAAEFDPQPFHLDETAAAGTLLGDLAASGWHTSAIGMRLVVDCLLAETASLGAPGVEAVRWLKPVRPGDTLTLVGRVVGTRLSRSMPDRGFVQFTFALHNQDGQDVMTQENSIMVSRRLDAGRP